MGGFLPWTPMNRCTKFDTASFSLVEKSITIQTHTHTQIANDISHLAYLHVWIITLINEKVVPRSHRLQQQIQTSMFNH